MTKNISWNNIEDEKDIEKLQYAFCFHDSSLKEARYISGMYANKDGSMRCFTNFHRVYMLFQSQWDEGVIEMLFDGVKNFHIGVDEDEQPMFGATIKKVESGIFLCTCDDSDNVDELKEYSDITWIEAKNCKWRFVKKYIGSKQVYIDRDHDVMDDVDKEGDGGIRGPGIEIE